MKENIEAFQRLLNSNGANLKVTGQFDKSTLEAAKKYYRENMSLTGGISGPTVKIGGLTLATAGINKTIEWETGGKAYYDKVASSPETGVGGASGVTIGVGYDLGQNTLEDFQKVWAPFLPANTFQRLAQWIKKTHVGKMSIFKDIKIPYETACQVFYKSTLPRFAAETARAYPGCQNLPPMVQSMLFSLTFNTGPGANKPGKKAIKQICANSGMDTRTKCMQIAAALESLTYGIKGVDKRRKEEAAFVRASC